MLFTVKIIFNLLDYLWLVALDDLLLISPISSLYGQFSLFLIFIFEKIHICVKKIIKLFLLNKFNFYKIYLIVQINISSILLCQKLKSYLTYIKN